MIEFKVRPVSRYSVTRYERNSGDGSCSLVGEFQNSDNATSVAKAMAGMEGGIFTNTAPEELDIPHLLKHISEMANERPVIKGVLVLEELSGEIHTFPLGERLGGIDALFDKGRAIFNNM